MFRCGCKLRKRLQVVFAKTMWSRLSDFSKIRCNVKVRSGDETPQRVRKTARAQNQTKKRKSSVVRTRRRANRLNARESFQLPNAGPSVRHDWTQAAAILTLARAASRTFDAVQLRWFGGIADFLVFLRGFGLGALGFALRTSLLFFSLLLFAARACCPLSFS